MFSLLSKLFINPIKNKTFYTKIINRPSDYIDIERRYITSKQIYDYTFLYGPDANKNAEIYKISPTPELEQITNYYFECRRDGQLISSPEYFQNKIAAIKEEMNQKHLTPIVIYRSLDLPQPIIDMNKDPYIPSYNDFFEIEFYH